MWPAVFDHLLGLLAAWAAGWAVRLLDDALDQDIDQALNKPNWSQRLGAGTTAYAVGALALASLLQPAVGLSLLVAAYAIGMISEYRLLPSGLPGWAEGIVLWLLCAWRFGLTRAWAAVGSAVAMQLLDDLIDNSRDEWVAARNWTMRLGLLGTGLVTGSLLAVVAWLDAWLLLYALLSFAYFQIQEWAMSRC